MKAIDFVALLIIFSAAPLSHAEVVDDANEMNPNSEIIDFEDFSFGPTSNPLNIGNATFSATPGLSIFDMTPWGANGTEVETKTLLPLPAHAFSGYTPMTIDFTMPVIEVGFGVWDPNLVGNILRVFDQDGILLEQAPITSLGPTDGSHATFIGIRRPTAEIAKAVFSPAATNEVYAIDNVTFLVPEPTSFSLLAIVGTMLFRRRVA